ncbi:MAG: GntR family transcriptional regulator [Flavobacteriales bacterium]|nr:GntR family transcriptional regulator [Flavobacteriales bacterium]
MIEIGKTTTLTVARIEEPGAFLSDGGNEFALLPSSQMDKGINVGDEIAVFVYTDAEEKLMATTKKPIFEVNELAFLEVTEQTSFGAFANYGLPKELLIPNSQQIEDLEIGDRCLTYLFVDEKTKRLVGSTKLHNFLNNDEITVANGDEVDLIAWSESDLGIEVVINNKHLGLVYANSIFQPIKEGDRLKGYIKEVREDNLIDVTIQKSGYANIAPSSKVLLEKLIASDGFLPFNDKSNPETIKYELHMSKKTFKKSVGWLYKHKMIRIEDDGIYFISADPAYDEVKAKANFTKPKAKPVAEKPVIVNTEPSAAIAKEDKEETEPEKPKASVSVKKSYSFKDGKIIKKD